MSNELHEMPEGEEKPPPGVRVMSVVRWSIVVLLATAAVAAWATQADVFHPRAPAPKVAEKKQKYVCPMHPQVVRDEPGDCPICGMALVPVTDEAEHREHEVEGLTAVELSPERIQLTGMKTAPVERKRVSPMVRTVGYVAADESRVVRVHARAAGWIEQLVANRTGDAVKPGEVLAKVYSPEVLAAERELVSLASQANSGGFARDLLDDARRKLKLLGLSDADVAEVERTGAANRTVSVRAPAAGVVTNKGAFEGLYFQPGTQLFEIADLSKVWVLADVYESELARVQVGQRATVELDAFRGKTFAGRVGFIYPAVDGSTRTMRVRVELPNPQQKLVPGMYGHVTIATGGEEGLVVPVDAMIDTGEAQYVFVAEGEGRFSPRRVRFGPRAGDGVQVLEGLEEGETVVTTANFLLDSESRLRAAVGAHHD